MPSPTDQHDTTPITRADLVRVLSAAGASTEIADLAYAFDAAISAVLHQLDRPARTERTMAPPPPPPPPPGPPSRSGPPAWADRPVAELHVRPPAPVPGMLKDAQAKLAQLEQQLADETAAAATATHDVVRLSGELKALRAGADRLLDEIERLRAQLPEGMKHCTIVFRSCAVGHGWLTATNWTQHGCPTCELEAARAELDQLRGQVVYLEGANETQRLEIADARDRARQAAGGCPTPSPQPVANPYADERARAEAKARSNRLADKVLAGIEQWTHEHGAALVPHGPDTFGEGMRTAKRQVAGLLANLTSDREPSAPGVTVTAWSGGTTDTRAMRTGPVVGGVAGGASGGRGSAGSSTVEVARIPTVAEFLASARPASGPVTTSDRHGPIGRGVMPTSDREPSTPPIAATLAAGQAFMVDGAKFRIDRDPNGGLVFHVIDLGPKRPRVIVTTPPMT